jgi:hypothetical protein
MEHPDLADEPRAVVDRDLVACKLGIGVALIVKESSDKLE